MKISFSVERALFWKNKISMITYVVQTFSLVSVLLFCSAYAKTFTCGELDTAACKTKFAKQFGADFKELHLNAMRKLLTNSIDIANSIKAELPKDDLMVPILEEVSMKVSKDLENLNESTDDNEKVSKIIEQAMNDITYNTSEKDVKSEDFKTLLEKYNAKKAIIGVIHQLAIDIGTLWANTYAGLRPEDIKAYPAYADVNELMETLRKPEANPAKIGAYANAAEILSNDFDISYFKYITDIA